MEDKIVDDDAELLRMQIAELERSLTMLVNICNRYGIHMSPHEIERVKVSEIQLQAINLARNPPP